MFIIDQITISLIMRKKKVERNLQTPKPTGVDANRDFNIWDQLSHRLSKKPFGVIL